MDLKRLRRRLAWELSEYLADFRNLWDELKSTEGWTALALTAVVIVLAAAWFIFGLGFDRLLSVAKSWGVWRPATCRDISDAHGLFVVLDGIAFMMVALLALGEMMLLVDRRRRHLPAKPLSVLIPTAAMLVLGLSGIFAMRAWC
jgi:hypothetical protein